MSGRTVGVADELSVLGRAVGVGMYILPVSGSTVGGRGELSVSVRTVDVGDELSVSGRTVGVGMNSRCRDVLHIAQR